MPRKYEQRRRAERRADTHQRIVEATVALHEEIGVARTTVSDVAVRAGVERATVYRHFPDERALVMACTGHYLAQHPPPDPASWGAITDPEGRLRVALTAVYAYHRRTERMADRTERDWPDAPVLHEVLAPIAASWAHVRDTLVGAWTLPSDRHALVVAAVGHAIAFSTWRSLVREQGLDDTRAVEVMAVMVGSLARGE